MWAVVARKVHSDVKGKKLDSTHNTYRMVNYTIEGGKLIPHTKAEVLEPALMSFITMRNEKVLNAGVRPNEKGTYELFGCMGALERFNDQPLVILAQLKTDGVVVGYTVCDYEGNIRTVQVEGLLNLCKRIYKQGKVPIQNMVYIPASDTLRSYSLGEEDLIPVINVKKKVSTPTPTSSNEKNKAEAQYSPSQQKVLDFIQKTYNLDLTKYCTPRYTPAQLRHIGIEMGSGLDVSAYNNPEYTVTQMSLIRCGVQKGLDVSVYANPELPESEMSEAIVRLECGMTEEAQRFRDPSYWPKYLASKGKKIGAGTMKSQRIKAMLKQRYKQRMAAKNAK